MSATNDPSAIVTALRRYLPLRPIINAVGAPPLQRRQAPGSRYSYLVRSIVYQQLAGSAASAIHGRLVLACNKIVTPRAIDALSDVELASCGLSGAKARAIRDLTAKVNAGEVRLERHGRLSDEKIISELVTVRGIGPWTAHMYLMSSLGRGDVWPTGDFAVRYGWSLIHDLEVPITARALDSAAEHLSPYRSAVSWYCWEAVALHRAQPR
jgi:DNA-3-methyladenine glycosylase II